MSHRVRNVLLAILVSFLVVSIVKANGTQVLDTRDKLQQSCNYKVKGFETAILIISGVNVQIVKIRKVAAGYYEVLGGDMVTAIKVGEIGLLCKPNIYSVQKIFSKSLDGASEGVEVMRDV